MTSRLVPLLISACGAALCFGLGACKSTSKKGTSGEYASAGDSNIIDYAGLPKDELPFDEKGNYREDWVSGTGSSSGLAGTASDSPYVQEDKPATVKRTTSSSTGSTSRKPPAVAMTSSTPPSPSPSTSTSKAKAKAKPKPATTTVAKKSKPKPKAKPVTRTTLYKVAKGDTLYGISRKTGRSVSAIKSYNGMKSDFLRDGWIIKLPPKKK